MDNTSPLVCICIPTYNAALTIRETLESILAQTYSNLVVIISDNASTDETLRVVESMADRRVIIHRNVENLGGEGNFNQCIQLAQGKYTAIFHADDLYEPCMVEKQVEFLDANQAIGAVLTAATTIDGSGKPFGIIGRSVANEQDVCIYEFKDLMKAILKRSNFLICPSAMVRTHIYQNEILSWRGDLFRSSSDLDVWLRIAKKHSIAILNEPLMRYRIDENQFSSKVRTRTERPDIFLVLDHYLSKISVKADLARSDWHNYRSLEINDWVWRSINLFSLGRLSDAKSMLSRVFNRDLIRAAVTSQRGLLTMIAAVALSIFITLNLRNFGNWAIKKLRKASNK